MMKYTGIMTDDKLQSLSDQVAGGKNLSNPPLHLWHPELSGDIDILIKRDGTWIHEGRPIQRPELVNLFASIMRREDDGEYYLLTPVEKWRLRVEYLPLLVTDFEICGGPGVQQRITVTLNTNRQYAIGLKYPLYLPELDGAEGIPAVQLDHGLAALFSRAAWYRLAELCEDSGQGPGVWSCGRFWPLG
jgi:hypothetical protein